MLASGFLAAPRWSRAQSARKTAPRIGFVFSNTPQADLEGPRPASPYLRAFLEQLRELGWVEGQNITVERRTAEGRLERYVDLARELMALRVALIVVSGTGGVFKVKEVSDTVPIVMAGGIAEALFSAGVAKSLARPGGTVTGLTTAIPGLEDKRLQLLKEAVPGASRVAYLGATAPLPANTDTAARALKLTVLPVETPRSEELEKAFGDLKRARADALLVVWGPTFFWSSRQRISDLAAQYRLPAIYWDRAFTEAGGLISYGPDYMDIDRRAAYHVDKILKGIAPGDIPIEQPVKFELVVNLKAARILALTIPPPFLARADLVIR
jgi:putative ABC transport system substrate-binding protein